MVRTFTGMLLGGRPSAQVIDLIGDRSSHGWGGHSTQIGTARHGTAAHAG